MSQNAGFLAELESILRARFTSPTEDSYTARLHAKGLDKILQKVGEECTEFIIDAKNGDKERTISEAADLMYHLLVALIASDLSLDDVAGELQRRHNARQ